MHNVIISFIKYLMTCHAEGKRKFCFPDPSVFPVEIKEIMEAWEKNKTWHFLEADEILVSTVLSCRAMIYSSHRFIAASIASLKM